MDISLLEEARDTLSYWHFGFHVINRPQSGRRLKDFIRLGEIGFDYRATRKASIVPRQFDAPQRHANFFLDASVIGSSISSR